jgi:hypothetical protein
MKTGYQVETTLALSKRHKMEPPFSMPKRKSPECYCTGARAAKRSTTKKKTHPPKKNNKKVYTESVYTYVHQRYHHCTVQRRCKIQKPELPVLFCGPKQSSPEKTKAKGKNGK